MFRKLVSNVAFSSALVGQLGFYAKRLRKEEATRKMGLIFIALSLVVQSFAVFTPPESANAANADNVIYSGIRNKEDLLAIYDRNIDSAGRTNIREIYSQFGITRNDISNMQLGSYNTGDFNGKIQSVGRSDWGVSYRYPVKVEGTNTTVYSGGYINTQGKSWKMPALIGKRSVDGAWFAITLDCGNPVYVTPPPPVKRPAAVCKALSIAPISRTAVRMNAEASTVDGAQIKAYTYRIKNTSGTTINNKVVVTNATKSTYETTINKDGTYYIDVIVSTSIGDKTDPNCVKTFTVSAEPRCVINPEFVESSTECVPCPADNTIWYKDSGCVAKFLLSKSVRNITQSKDDADNTTAHAGDQLQYTLQVKNTGKDTGIYTMSDSVADILEYTTVVNLGDGLLSTQPTVTPAVITWPSSTLKAGETIEKVFVVKVKETIPAMATNMSNPQSYNCRVTNTFGNTLNINVDCPPEKVIEQTITELPNTGASENMLFSILVISVAVFFYARSRQMSTEIRLVRRSINTGSF